MELDIARCERQVLKPRELIPSNVERVRVQNVDRHVVGDFVRERIRPPEMEEREEKENQENEGRHHENQEKKQEAEEKAE